MSRETYLGDGLFASMDGWQTICLRAPRENGDHLVYLELPVWNALQRFVQEQDQKRRQAARPEEDAP